MLALCAVFLATFRDYRPHLAPGERDTIMDRRRMTTLPHRTFKPVT
jgi:hypothetical protein